MRVIVVGCEYTGVTTLIEGLMDWGRVKGIEHHLDDHFSIPDRQTMNEEDRRTMLGLSPDLKERFQRFQVVYHVWLLKLFQHILLGGFHIEEAVYGPLYYYPGKKLAPDITRRYETEMPTDTLLVLLTASPEVIERRMSQSPHDYPVVQRGDIQTVLDRFEREYRESWLSEKMQIDTSNLDSESLLNRFLDSSLPFLNERDLLTRMTDSGGLTPGP